MGCARTRHKVLQIVISPKIICIQLSFLVILIRTRFQVSFFAGSMTVFLRFLSLFTDFIRIFDNISRKFTKLASGGGVCGGCVWFGFNNLYFVRVNLSPAFLVQMLVYLAVQSNLSLCTATVKSSECPVCSVQKKEVTIL